jgi:Ca2+-binding RTX toxin-like protein
MFRKLFVSPQPSRRHAPVAARHLETLENRTLFSTFYVDPYGQLIVTGTNGDDTAMVTVAGLETPYTGDDVVRAHVTYPDGSYVNGHWPASQIIRAVIISGPGNDNLSTGCPFATTIYGDEGDDGIRGGWGHAYLVGGPGNDRIAGGGSMDVIYGGDGDDFLYGYGGPDLIYGEAGNDVLRGNDGDDHLRGGDGSDRLFGEAGIDRLYGENGDDRLDTGDDTDSGEIAYGGNGWDAFKYRPGDQTDRLFFELLY